jgi:hypothetical protein
MRKGLRKYSGQTRIFTATLKKFCAKKGEAKLSVVLLIDLRMDGDPICDHVYISRHGFADWMKGGEVTFKAKIVKYQKNHVLWFKAKDWNLELIKMLHCTPVDEETFIDPVLAAKYMEPITKTKISQLGDFGVIEN